MIQPHNAPAPDGTTAGVVLLGLMGGKPHAARFLPEEAALAATAAELMGLRVIALDDPRKLAAAEGTATGRIFASGRAFCPFVKRPTFDALCVLGGFDPTEEIARPARLGASGADVSPTTDLPPVRLPKDWDDLGPGCLCLAREGVGHGWFECTIEAVVSEGLLLAWRDCDPGEWPPIIRRPDQIALLPPDAGSADDHLNA